MKTRVLAALLPLCLLATALQAATPVERADVARDAQIVSASGGAWVRFVRDPVWFDALREQVLTAGDVLKTGDYGRMGVLFADGTQIRVSRKTVLAIRAVGRPENPGPTTLGVEAGEVFSRAKAVPEGLRIETPSASAAIRGTDWALRVEENGTTTVTVLEGRVVLANEHGSLVVEPGQQAVAEVGKAPAVRTFLMRPWDRVQWVFSYELDVADLASFHSFRRSDVLKELPSARARVQADPEDVDARLFLAGLLFDAGERRESGRLLDEVLSMEPDNGRALAFRGLLALHGQELDLADALFDRALAAPSGGGRVEALGGKVGVLAARGEIGRAAGWLGEMEKEGKPPLAGLVSAAFAAFDGDFTRGVQVASEYAARYPRDERFPILTAGLYMVLNDWDRARKGVEAGLQINAESSPGHTALAAWYHSQGMGKEAASEYRRAIDLDPTYELARSGFALLLMEEGYFGKAGGQLDRVLASAPENPMFWANRGLLFTLEEKLGKAREDYGRALAEDPTHYVSLNGLGLVALKEGRTQEAIRFFLEASLLEPDFALPHDFLAIAYYQMGKMDAALQELELARALDPRDPFPHVIAYIMYQDTYRPWEAVQEARQALERLPFQKSVQEIENTKSAASNLGTALLGFGLRDWAENYAQESYNPYDASSHFESYRRYNDNRIVSQSELLQGLLLDPLANSSPPRYQDIIRKPRWDAVADGTWGDDDGGFSQAYGCLLEGYFREPWQVSWSLGANGYDNEGAAPNAQSLGGIAALGVGVEPDYRNGFNLLFSMVGDASGAPGSSAIPDPDDERRTLGLSADLGYRHRFGPENVLLARAGYYRRGSDLHNPAPFGTGLTDVEASFLVAGFGTEETRRFFEQGVYDLSLVMEPGDMATDSTGTLAGVPGVVREPCAFPAFVDTDVRSLDRLEETSYAAQARHLFNLGDRNEVTCGVEVLPVEIEATTVLNVFPAVGGIQFYEEPILDPWVEPWVFARVARTRATVRSRTSGGFLTAYVDDRWQPTDWLLFEVGLFLESFRDDTRDDTGFYPRAGVAVRFLKNQWLRLGYQQWLEKSGMSTLAPVLVAGLVADNSLALPGSRIYDYQARLESRWTRRLFTVMGGELADLRDQAFGPYDLGRRLRCVRATAAVNAIPWRQIGVFVTYAYSHARMTGGVLDGLPVPGVPEHLVRGGVVWISPWYVKVLLSETYVGEQAAGYDENSVLDDTWTTDVSASWEPLQKRVGLALAANNLFNADGPVRGTSVFGTLTLRF